MDKNQFSIFGTKTLTISSNGVGMMYAYIAICQLAVILILGFFGIYVLLVPKIYSALRLFADISC